MTITLNWSEIMVAQRLQREYVGMVSAEKCEIALAETRYALCSPVSFPRARSLRDNYYAMYQLCKDRWGRGETLTVRNWLRFLVDKKDQTRV